MSKPSFEAYSALLSELVVVKSVIHNKGFLSVPVAKPLLPKPYKESCDVHLNTLFHVIDGHPPRTTLGVDIPIQELREIERLLSVRVQSLHEIADRSVDQGRLQQLGEQLVDNCVHSFRSMRHVKNGILSRRQAQTAICHHANILMNAYTDLLLERYLLECTLLQLGAFNVIEGVIRIRTEITDLLHMLLSTRPYRTPSIKFKHLDEIPRGGDRMLHHVCIHMLPIIMQETRSVLIALLDYFSPKTSVNRFPLEHLTVECLSGRLSTLKAIDGLSTRIARTQQGLLPHRTRPPTGTSGYPTTTRTCSDFTTTAALQRASDRSTG